MLKSLIKDIAGRFGKSKAKTEKIAALSEQAAAAQEEKDYHKSIELMRAILAIEPQNVQITTRLGIALYEIGEISEAYACFELAHQLDDASMEVAVNYARCLADRQLAREALVYLKRAQVVIPYYPYISNIYAGIQLSIGNSEMAREFSQRAWLKNFDNGRMVDSYLWHSAYVDMPEEDLASEHHFWAGTCAPLPLATSPPPTLPARSKGGKIRIGYWSPDFRNHSVRYFFRPLLEGHDRTKVEIYLYHDISTADSQTEEIEKHCDAFHDVFACSDEDLRQLIHSHDLDVLVELAGHTSHNRLWLMQERLAKLQLTGIGYPPTTGLSTIDAKWIDPHILTEDAPRFYTEKPLVLPHSFWCFDPCETVDVAAEPPFIRNGFITFACIGNIAKISAAMLDAWAEIMRRVPRSRLLLRSVNFANALAVESTRARLLEHRLDVRRVDLLPPAGGADFFKSYDGVDIILDTFPFNGGTTTCFAAFMGVPVVTLQGRSLLSRMGASVMINAGAGALVAKSRAQYVSIAIGISQDRAFLEEFRKNSRQRMRSNSLGDGAKFAGDVEEALQKMLGEMPTTREYAHSVSILPAHEIIRRAATVLSAGNTDAAARIVAYCLKYYPNFSGAHILATERFTQAGDYKAAAHYLAERLASFDNEGRVAAIINIVRYHLLEKAIVQADAALHDAEAGVEAGSREEHQVRLLRALIDNEGHIPPAVETTARSSSARRFCFLIPCDDRAEFERRTDQIRGACAVPAGSELHFVRAEEARRIQVYEEHLKSAQADIVVLMQKNISIHRADFLQVIQKSLEQADIVGFSGASQWKQLDWLSEGFDKRAAGFWMRSAEKSGYVELAIAGPGRQVLEKNMAVLDGGMLALNAAAVSDLPFDPAFLEARTLLEEVWCYQAFQAGRRLAVHRALGVQLHGDIPLQADNFMEARLALAEQRDFDVFASERTDQFILSAPASTPEVAMRTLITYFASPVPLRPAAVGQA